MGFYIAISLGLEACREHKTEPLQLGISSFPSHFVFLSSLLSMTTLQTIRDVSRRKRKGMIDISFFLFLPTHYIVNAALTLLHYYHTTKLILHD